MQEPRSPSESAGDRERLERCLAAVAPFLADEAAGFYGPGSLAWLVYREPPVLLAGLAAVLLQVAHPAVAAGVWSRSAFRADLVGRTLRTGAALHRLTFGPASAAVDLSRRLHAVHARVRGHSDDAGAYRANDPELLYWVWATLVDTPPRLWQALYRPLRTDERERFYAEARRSAVLLGVPDALLPPDPAAFARDYTRRLADLRVSDDGRAIAAALLASPLCRLVPGARTITTALLPPALRAQFGLRFGARDERRYQLALRALRLLIRTIPAPLRAVPAYQRARVRVAVSRLLRR